MVDTVELRLLGALWFLREIGDEEVRQRIRIPEQTGVDVTSLLREMHALPLSSDQAREWALIAQAMFIADGSLAPIEGARAIGRLFAGTDWGDDITPFIGLASDWDDFPELRATYEERIREAAQEILRTRQPCV